jgi:hypothetical protein
MVSVIIFVIKFCPNNMAEFTFKPSTGGRTITATFRKYEVVILSSVYYASLSRYRSNRELLLLLLMMTFVATGDRREWSLVILLR